MNKWQKFIEEHRDEVKSIPVNMTDEQIAMVNGVADMVDVSFEDMITIMIHTQLKQMDEWLIKQKIQKKARLN